uniref:Uncharacterized protein n=1 Tax=Anopheles dirus TaxID=7168 RepID=A0A182NIZ4_9DIPT
MNCYALSSLLCLVTLLVRAGVGEGIEKVSYLLQYGPGVHTVFEQENPPDKGPVSANDRVAPSTTPSTLTSKWTASSVVTPGKTQQVTHGAMIQTAVTPTAPTVPPVSDERDSGTSSTTTLSTTTTSSVRAAGSTASGGVRRRNPADTAQLCHTSSVSVLETHRPLPLPPTLPAFGANLRSDVVVNLKPKELRTLMSTYIALIEAYKSYNQQQRRNIAHLEEELARHELIAARAERLRKTKLQLQLDHVQ